MREIFDMVYSSNIYTTSPEDRSIDILSRFMCRRTKYILKYQMMLLNEDIKYMYGQMDSRVADRLDLEGFIDETSEAFEEYRQREQDIKARHLGMSGNLKCFDMKDNDPPHVNDILSNLYVLYHNDVRVHLLEQNRLEVIIGDNRKSRISLKEEPARKKGKSKSREKSNPRSLNRKENNGGSNKSKKSLVGKSSSKQIRYSKKSKGEESTSTGNHTAGLKPHTYKEPYTEMMTSTDNNTAHFNTDAHIQDNFMNIGMDSQVLHLITTEKSPNGKETPHKPRETSSEESVIISVAEDIQEDTVDGEYEDGKKYRITYSNGYYIGSVRGKKRNGSGVYVWKEGSRYEGEWRNDKKEGMGLFKWKGGDVYEGEYVGDRREGKGRKVYSSGEVYEGDWVAGKREGFGVWTGKRATLGFGVWGLGLEEKYVGGYRNNKREGEGRMEWANGCTYEGSWESGRMEGWGTFSWGDGEEYVGEWVGGERSGKGCKVWPSGTRYTVGRDNYRESGGEIREKGLENSSILMGGSIKGTSKMGRKMGEEKRRQMMGVF